MLCSTSLIILSFRSIQIGSLEAVSLNTGSAWNWLLFVSSPEKYEHFGGKYFN